MEKIDKEDLNNSIKSNISDKPTDPRLLDILKQNNDNYQPKQQETKPTEDDAKYISHFDNTILSLQSRLDELFTQEREQVKQELEQLSVMKTKFEEYKETEKIKLKKEKTKWYSEYFSKLTDTNKIIDLNIGGKAELTTTLATLTKYPFSVLGLLFSGNFNLPMLNDRVFIDRDSVAFTHLITYLRTSKFPLFKSRVEEQLFKEELDFWKIPYTSINRFNRNNLKDFTLPYCFDPDWCAPTLDLENNNTLIRKNNKDHGIVFFKRPLDQNNSYLEFKIVMSSKSRGRSHLFIGIVDRLKYKTENLVSTYWRDSPSSFYWDVWNNKLIKTDENGSQVATVNGYGCLCEEVETRIGISYCPLSRCVSFIKDGINQGVAFRNIPAVFYPSLDIWFEIGTVELVPNAVFNERGFL